MEQYHGKVQYGVADRRISVVESVGHKKTAKFSGKQDQISLDNFRLTH